MRGDAGPADGILGLHAGNVVVDAQYANMNSGASPGMYFRLSLSDTGTGIVPDVIRESLSRGTRNARAPL